METIFDFHGIDHNTDTCHKHGHTCTFIYTFSIVHAHVAVKYTLAKNAN